MDAKAKIVSKTFVKDLLIIDALQNTDRENPKTARKIIKEVDEKLYERLCQRFCVNSKPPKNANFW